VFGLIPEQIQMLPRFFLYIIKNINFSILFYRNIENTSIFLLL